MQKGELSNEVLPRIYVVFEGLVGVLPDARHKALEALHRRRGHWDKAVNQYTLSINTKQGLRDIYWRHHYRVDVLTFYGNDFADAVRDRLDSANLLFGDVVAYDPQELQYELTYDRSILAVLDPDPAHVLTYGSKGRVVSPSQLNLMALIQ